MNALPTSETPRAEGNLALALFVGLLAAGAGALVWGAVSYFTGYEVGYVAWALGGLVGVSIVKLGGRGMACAGAAAVLTVAGIAGGKLLGTRFVVEKEFQEYCAATFSKELHREVVADASDLEQLGEDPSDEELQSFMVEHRYTDADSPEDVQPAELAAFLATEVPNLRALHANRTSYQDWSAAQTARSHQAFEEEFSLVQANLDGLNGFDLLFVALGVSTAFGVVRRASQPAAEPAAGSEPQTRKAA
jgi:hypothetical protein